MTIYAATETLLNVYSQTSIIRGTWAYLTLTSKTADDRGPRIIEVQIIEV